MQYWRIKLSLFLNYIVFAILLNSVGIVVLQVINHYGVDKSAAGNLDAFKDITIAVVSFCAASFLPRIGYRHSMLIGLFIVTLICFFVPIIDQYWMIKLLLISVGVGFSLIKVAAYSTVGLITKTTNEHVSFVSLLEGIFMFGVLSGFWLFGFFIHKHSGDWLDTYFVTGFLALMAFLLLLFTPFDESGSIKKQNSIKDDLQSMLQLNRHPVVIIFVICVFTYVFVEQGINTWLPTFNNKTLHITPAMSIEMASIFAASIGIGRITASVLLRQITWFSLVACFTVCAACLIGLILPLTEHLHTHFASQWSQVSWVAYLLPLVGFFIGPIYPTLISTTLSSLPKHQHSPMMGLIMIYSALGGSFGSKLIGVTFQWVGGQLAMVMATLIPLTILFILLFPYKRAST